MSDKVFKGNRGATGVFFMTTGDHRHCRLLAQSAGQSGRRYGLYDHHWLPDLRPGDADWSACPRAGAEKAAGTAAGFTGLFGYLGGSVVASAIVGYTVDFFGWDGGFMVMIGGSVLAVILLVIVMLGERRHHQQLKQA